MKKSSYSFMFSINFLSKMMVIILSSGCWLTDISRKDQKKTGKARLLDRSREMIIERVDQKSSAYLRFYTTDLAYCKIEIWPKYLGDAPNSESKELVKCDYSGPTDQHLIRIERLRNLDPYFFKVSVSRNENMAQIDDSIVLEETQDSFSFFPPPGYEKSSREPHTGTLIRANLPFGVGKIHSKKISVTFKNTEVQKFTEFKEGCSQGIRKTYTPFLPSSKNELSNISSSGYIIATSRKLEDRFDTFALDFSEIIPSKPDMAIISTLQGQKSTVKAKAPAYFNFLKLRSANSREISLAKPDLTVNSGRFTIQKDSDLVLLWDAKNNSDIAYITALIGKNTSGSAVKCIFKAEKNSGIITSKVIQKLKDGPHDLLVTLNSKQVLNSSENHTILFHAQDWRHKEIVLTRGQ